MNVRRFSRGRFLLWLGLAITMIGALTYFVQQTPIIAKFDTRQPGLYFSLAGVALSGVGLALEMWKGGVVWHKSIGAKTLSISLIITALYVGNTYFAFNQEDVQFMNGDVTLAGTLLIPNGKGPHPAMVMMHGSGQVVRMGTFAEAQSLARQGVAVLIYDKRGSGESVGGHYRFDGYEALANDGVAAFNFLQSRSDIDPNRIGLWGTSEGGWTAPMAASNIDDTAFLIVVSGGPLTPEEQGAYSMANRLRNQGFSDEAVGQAIDLSAQYNAYIRTGMGRNELMAAQRKANSEGWFEAADHLPITVPVYNELSERQEWWKDHMDTDVAALLEQMDFPILFVLGANDPLIPGTLVKEQVGSILETVGHQDFSVEIFPEATHNLMVAPTDCGICMPDKPIGPFRPLFAPGYLDTVSDWVTQRVDTES